MGASGPTLGALTKHWFVANACCHGQGPYHSGSSFVSVNIIRSFDGKPRFVLSPEEEQLRCQLSWQRFDEKQHLLAFGDREELHEFVSEPDQVMKHRKELVIELEDEISLWIPLGMEEQVAATTKEGLQLSRVCLAASKKGKDMSSILQQEQQQSQVRGTLPHGQEKVRVTYVDRNVVYHAHDPEKAPEGQRIKPVLIVPGLHARISNITLEPPYKWINTETFEYLGQEITHTANTSTKGTMKEWCELRKKCPYMFEQVVLMQQPAAWRDEVIVTWCQEDLHMRFQNKPILQVHDMVCSQYSKGSREKAYSCNQVKSVIAGEMTAVLQLTDISIAKMAKDILQECKHA